MDCDLPADVEQLRRTVRKFVDEAVIPVEPAIERWRPGAAGCYSPGVIKVVTCLKRKAGMSVEEFQAYWRERHPAVVVRLPGLRRYVQSHTRLAGYRKGEPIYDGIAEVWFDDSGAMHALRGTDELAAVEADEPRFMNSSTKRVILTDARRRAALRQGRGRAVPLMAAQA